MFTVLVHLRVKADHLEDFLAAISANAAASLQHEPGCLIFDVQHHDWDPLNYLLYEVYRDEDAFRVEHRAAPHYAAWQEAAERCLEPGGRTNSYYTPVTLGRKRLDPPGKSTQVEMVSE